MLLKKQRVSLIVKVFFSILFSLFAFLANAQNNEPAIVGLSDLPPACGNEPITIALMQWPSAAILTNIHAQILKQQYGCEVKIITGDLATTMSSMATTASPLVAPEVWISLVPDLYNAGIENQSIRKSSNSFSNGALEAWFIPDYIASNHKELTSIAVLKDYWRVFSLNGKKAKFISCPKDWACSIINKNLLKALNLDRVFDIIEPSDRFELDNIIADAVSRREAILFYYWQSNSLLEQFNFLALDMGEFNIDNFNCLGKNDCLDPKLSSFIDGQVAIILSNKIFTQSPQVASYFQRASMPINEMNRLLYLQSQGNKTASEIANWFVVERKEIWQSWVDGS